MIFKKKTRYLLVEASESANLSDPINVDCLKREMLAFLGQLPCFKANPQVAAQLNDRVFVMSVNRGYEASAILALSFIKKLNGKKVGFYTIRTSGTIRSIRNYFSKTYGSRSGPR